MVHKSTIVIVEHMHILAMLVAEELENLNKTICAMSYMRKPYIEDRVGPNVSYCCPQAREAARASNTLDPIYVFWRNSLASQLSWKKNKPTWLGLENNEPKCGLTRAWT